MEEIGSLFDDIPTEISNCGSIAGENGNLADIGEILIQPIDLNDVLVHNKVRYNTNNIWINGERPEDYDLICEQCNLDKWIDKFHKSYAVINIPIEYWMKNALGFGMMTGQLSNLFKEDIDSYIKRHETNKIRELLSSNYNFVRSNRVSLKRGVHGHGPYKSLRQITESLITTDQGHTPLREKEFNEGSLKLYLMEWIDMSEYKEFRVFVKDRKITAISQQSLYTSNSLLINMSPEQRDKTIRNWVRIIQNYYHNVIAEKLNHINSYCIDIVILEDESPYFIEINPFGKEYSSGSSLFGWIQDEEILYGKTDKLCFRYTR